MQGGFLSVAVRVLRKDHGANRAGWSGDSWLACGVGTCLRLPRASSVDSWRVYLFTAQVQANRMSQSLAQSNVALATDLASGSISPGSERVFHLHHPQNNSPCGHSVFGSTGTRPSRCFISLALAGEWPAQWLLK